MSTINYHAELGCGNRFAVWADLDCINEAGTAVGGRYVGEVPVDFVMAIDLAPRCRADISLDGLLDPDDLADFIAIYFGSPTSPLADFDGNCQTDPDDLADFIGAFFTGCG